jgi:hypothetical protein
VESNAPGSGRPASADRARSRLGSGRLGRLSTGLGYEWSLYADAWICPMPPDVGTADSGSAEHLLESGFRVEMLRL